MTLVAGLRAAAYGVPFQPVGGVHGSDLAALNGWQKIRDPYGSGKDVYVIPAISPDIAVIHANEVDEQGNARVLSSPRVATLNNQKAVLKVGTDEFFVTNVATVTTTTGTTTQQTPTVTVAPFFSGVMLDVTPQIDGANNIKMH